MAPVRHFGVPATSPIFRASQSPTEFQRVPILFDLPRLPVSHSLDDLSTALGERRSAVLVAPPGAGKTTLVPLHLLGGGSPGTILLVEPRRLAARAAARRMAEIARETVGETIGWRMRLDTKVSARTRIEVVTEGVFTRMILGDPELAGVCAVIFDEFHERSLDGDFGLALALDVQGALREDLRILVMSATLDGARVSSLLGDAPVITSEGRGFPIEIRHREHPGTERIEDAMASAIREILATETGSVLAFLPGQREIERVAERLAGRLAANTILAPLYGAMDGAAQDLAIRPAPAGQRKVVLATSIAETSLTIDGVRVVIDSGLSRRPRFEPATGLSRLETVRVSKASADQRAGRAGRTEPGIALRLWRAEQTAALEAFDPPEIMASDLSGLLLDCAAWGVADPRDLAFLDPPPEPALNEARRLLADLGALDGDGRLTAAGEAMRGLPLPPRLARMVVAAGRGDRLMAARLAVLLTERGLGGNDADLAERLRRFETDRGPRARSADALARRIAQSADGGEEDASRDPRLSGEAGALLALAYPDRIAVRRGVPGAYGLSNGRGGLVDPAEALARHRALVVADLVGAAKSTRIVAAAPLSEEALAAIVERDGLAEDVLLFDRNAKAVRARRIERLGRIILSETPLKTPTGEAAATALMEGLAGFDLSILPFGKEGERLLRRLRFLAGADPEVWPDLSEETLRRRLAEWLGPFVPGATSLSEISEGQVSQALHALVPGPVQGRLGDLAPSHFEAPSGNRHPIRYEDDQPVLSIRVQELFGLTRHPSIAEGRLPLTIELLSPAQRPIQITRDLPGFWSGSWADVRADLRGRYPRHEWPEDPANAAPTARAKRRTP
ncbi:ATP-dependent helicase HrpB [Fulvimarina endophytica]|uniref:ATP-dependent helicase HrpB n=1 Tax=Fulvimarina endophytica TaxID=2293836 RepID=A0A371X1D0_9HYPH|nr:ATP-dependent helicase HrpB [Fulvimarina endophytica]RFC63035.1 ATP-dependent helicase HrpB [Fulvimarina endophytica]